MDYMKEHDILIETVASQQGTIRKLVDEITRLSAREPIYYIGEKHPEPTEHPCPMPTYPPAFPPFCPDVKFMDDADKERMLNGDRTD